MPQQSEFIIFFKNYYRLFISHHPVCENFQGHTIMIGKYHVCRGCFFGYLGCFFMLIYNLFFPNMFSYLNYILLMIVFFLFHFIKFFNRIYSSLTKIFLGMTLGCGILAIIKAPILFYGIIFLYLFTNIALAYIALRYIRLSKICYSCKEYNNIPHCSGFQDFICV
jgi:hypothetical protein